MNSIIFTSKILKFSHFIQFITKFTKFLVKNKSHHTRFN